MFFKLLRILISAVGFMIGPGVLWLCESISRYFFQVDFLRVLPSWGVLLIYVASGVLSGLILLALSKKIALAIEQKTKSMEKTLSAASSYTLLSGAIGLIIGLVIAALISNIIGLIPIAWISVPLTIAVYLIFGYLGMSTGVKRRGDLQNFSQNKKMRSPESKKDGLIHPKILDTSVIIDGRIYDICKTGIVEGELIIPEFVLVELRHIADSEDSMKRTKGRRGLDVLNKIQRKLTIPVRVVNNDYEDILEVDAKLLKLTKEMEGVLVTNDYNLNKVAAVQNVPVFNINELANAVKPILMAGEELQVTIVKEGKEASQGIAYLDDGTMIVVEGAKGMVDQTMNVVVTSILQTAAGRMIFAKIK